MTNVLKITNFTLKGWVYDLLKKNLTNDDRSWLSITFLSNIFWDSAWGLGRWSNSKTLISSNNILFRELNKVFAVIANHCRFDRFMNLWSNILLYISRIIEFYNGMLFIHLSKVSLENCYVSGRNSLLEIRHKIWMKIILKQSCWFFLCRRKNSSSRNSTETLNDTKILKCQ